jgi:glycerol-3-phosphate acyltransferase PlsX
MRIVIDAMGGDLAPRAAVEGAVLAARAFHQTCLLVGRAPEIEAALAGQQCGGLDIELVHAPDVIAMDELSPAQAIRTTPDNSISRAIALVRDGEADAFVTAGHTGATLAAATFGLGRLPGVRRPALATPFPTRLGPCVLIDIGANAEVKPEYLLQFGVMGAAYAERVLGIQWPRVGLVSIGEERGKGTTVVQQALPLFEASRLHFIGNVEGRDIPAGLTDVAVMDGFTGNVMIKFAEGLAGLVEQLLREAAQGDPLGLLGGLLLRPSLRRARRRMDYRAYGGAVLLGVRGVVVIGHGRSDPEAVKTAVGVAVRAVENDLVGAIARGVEAPSRNVTVAAVP